MGFMMERVRAGAGVVLAMTALGGCGLGVAVEIDDDDDAQSSSDSALSAGIDEGTPEAAGVLKVVNTVDESTLVDNVGFNGRNERKAARKIVARRDGPDAVAGTGDDLPFTTIAELDAVSYVGPVQFQKLLAWAKAHDLLPQASCSWGDAFFERYGQRFSPEDIALVLSDGRVVRGLSQLKTDAGFTLKDKSSGLNVKALRLLRPQTYSVIAELNSANDLNALTSAVNHTQMGYPAQFLPDTALRIFTQPAWSLVQSQAALISLVDALEQDIAPSDLAGYRAAAAKFIQRIKGENFAGTVYELRRNTVIDSVEFWPRAPSGWDASLGVRFNGKSYWRSVVVAPTCGGCRQVGNLLACDGGKTYEQATAYCEGKGGTLASSHSRKDDMTYRAMFGDTRIWIGLDDLDREGNFAFADESAVDYIGFGPKQPDNWGNNENCVELATWSGTEVWWNDMDCAAPQSFICRL